ncbi:hypothetical protein N9K16_05855 [Alphaproteobacteria bacterium]|nr:hypothetical protein [Alphaproteobacteria bacterium]
MTVKTAVSFTDRHHVYAKKKVEEGSFSSVSSVVAAGIEQIMRDEEEREAALGAMADTIRRRMDTPREEWVIMDGNSVVFERARARILAVKK